MLPADMRTAGAESAYGDKAWGAAAEDVQKWLSPLVAGFHSQAVDCATVWVRKRKDQITGKKCLLSSF